MSHLSEEDIRALEPESLRYDVTLEDDFVVSVLPNGIKTWAFLYEHEGRPRRKTLGIHPDMSMAQAREALLHARTMAEKLGGDLDAAPEIAAAPASDPAVLTGSFARPAVLASGHRRRKIWDPSEEPRRPRRWPRYLAGGVLLAGAVAAVAYLVVTRPPGETTDSVDAAPATPARSTPAEARPAASEPAAAPGKVLSNPFSERNRSSDDDEADADSSEAGGERDESDGDATSPQGATAAPEQPRVVSVSQPAAPEPEPEPEPQPVEAPAPTEHAPALTAEADTQAEPAADGDDDAAAPPVRTAPEAAPPEPATIASSDAAAERSVAAAATDSNDESRIRPAPEAATSRGGSVPRAIITSAVEGLEPVDDLGDRITLRNSGFQSVFFFTELRNFSDGNVVHRWVYNGDVLADVPLKVQKSWRWRTYSSKDLLPGMTGNWSVSVIDSNGEVLASRDFTFLNDASAGAVRVVPDTLAQLMH